jgi:zinc transporter ZupT
MTGNPISTAILAAESWQALGWLIIVILALIRDYGWMIALAGFAVVGLLRRASHPLRAAAMTCLFTGCSLLLPVSIVLNYVTFATPPKAKTQPPAEVRKALTN